MLPLIGAAALGAILMGRTKPKTRAFKRCVLGRKTGVAYDVEDFESAGFVVASHPQQGVSAVLVRRSPGSGLGWHRGVCGSPEQLRQLYLDLCTDLQGGET